MVESETISIMDEGLGDQVDLLVSKEEYPGVTESLDGAGATHEVL